MKSILEINTSSLRGILFRFDNDSLIIIKWVASILFFFFLLFPQDAPSEITKKIDLHGRVPERMELKISSQDFHFGNPTEIHHQDTPLATISILSNAENGWSLILSNKNEEFQLKNGAHSAPYSLKYGNSIINHSAKNTIIDHSNHSNGATIGKREVLTISSKPDKNLPSGTYTDQIILEIQAN